MQQVHARIPTIATITDSTELSISDQTDISTQSTNRHFPKPRPKIKNHRNRTGSHFVWGLCINLHIACM